MATRAKPKEIVAESQKVFGFVMKAHKWIAIPLAVITIIVVAVWSIRDFRHEEGNPAVSRSMSQQQSVTYYKQAASAVMQQKEVMTLSIPAGNSSGLIPPIAGKHPEVTGFGKFSAYAVREDDTVCEADEPSCVNGPLLKGYYVTNESGKANTYTVNFK